MKEKVTKKKFQYTFLDLITHIRDSNADDIDHEMLDNFFKEKLGEVSPELLKDLKLHFKCMFRSVLDVERSGDGLYGRYIDEEVS